MPFAIQIHETGGPEVMHWENVEVGEPGPGEVRLAHVAVGLNFIDISHRTGRYELPLPFIPGVEGAGTVEALGEGVDGIEIGDRVAYAGSLGGYAEKRLIAADRVVRLPAGISFEQAAAIMLKGMTAHMLLQQVYAVREGDAILIHAAAGGTGSYMCQWAAALGATVIGTVSNDTKAERARANGCHYPIVYTREDFVEEVDRITGGKKLRVVYDSVGRDTFMRSLDCLQPRGLMVSFGQASGPPDPIAPRLLAQKGSLYLTRPSILHYIQKRSELEETARGLFEAIDDGKIRVSIEQRFPLSEASKAHAQLESRSTTGSTVLTL